MRLLCYPSVSTWIDAAIGEFLDSLAEARSRHRSLELLLAGGSTPKELYPRLASLDLESPAIHIWIADEREVPSADPARNGAMIHHAFSAASWFQPEILHLWPEMPSEVAAARYANEIAGRLGPRPHFDLAFLGVGSDGHTASLFPGDAILSESLHLAASSFAPAEPRRRMSLTFSALRGARRVRYLLRGKAKLNIVQRLARGEAGLPATHLADLVDVSGGDTAILYCEAE